MIVKINCFTPGEIPSHAVGRPCDLLEPDPSQDQRHVLAAVPRPLWNDLLRPPHGSRATPGRRQRGENKVVQQSKRWRPQPTGRQNGHSVRREHFHPDQPGLEGARSDVFLRWRSPQLLGCHVPAPPLRLRPSNNSAGFPQVQISL